jgi:hypothetical protein
MPPNEWDTVPPRMEATQALKRTQSFTGSTQSVAERREMALRAKRINRSNGPPREAPIQ